jgi:hypothetical protein
LLEEQPVINAPVIENLVVEESTSEDQEVVENESSEELPDTATMLYNYLVVGI